MSNNFWDQENNEDESEYATLDSVERDESNYYEPEDIDDEIMEKIENDSAFDLDDRETAVIYNARLRLEQAKLYEMLINHNLFEGVDANPQAIQNVQNELKEYIVERLEILMGMRKERQLVETPAIEVAIDSEFNDIEREFLKQLAYKGTKGASSKGTTETKVQTIKPVVQNNSFGLKPLVKKEVNLSNDLEKKELEIKPQLESKKVKRKVPVSKRKKTTKSVKTDVKRTKIVNKNLKPRELTKNEIEKIAMEELKRDQEILGKNKWDKMSIEEKSKVLSRKNSSNRVKGKGVIPTPTQEQINSYYIMKEQNRHVSQNGISQFNTKLAEILAARKNK